MAKVTSKLQMTIPKAAADRLGIRPGDEVDVVVEGNALRVRRDRAQPVLTVDERMAVFQAAMVRQDARMRGARKPRSARAADRGWTRADLYDRDRSR